MLVGTFSVKYVTHHDFKCEGNKLYKTIELNLFNCWFINIFSSDTCGVSSVVGYNVCTFLINVSHLLLFLFFSHLRSYVSGLNVQKTGN